MVLKEISSVVDKLSTIHALLEKDSPDRPQYVSRAIQWSAQNSQESQNRAGHPDLHQRFAHTSWQGVCVCVCVCARMQCTCMHFLPVKPVSLSSADRVLCLPGC